MKIYVTDFGWAGSLIIIANSWEEAFGFAQKSWNIQDFYTLEKYQDETLVKEIEPGIVSDNMGDS